MKPVIPFMKPATILSGCPIGLIARDRIIEAMR